MPCGGPRRSALPDAMRQSPVARSCQHRSRTKGPSLHQHYPASPVLRPYPPPQGAGSVPHDTTVGQHRLPATPRGFPCCTQPLFRTCRRHYPGGTVGCLRRSLPQRRRPSPKCRRVGFRIDLFEACSAFTARYGLYARRVPYGPFTPEASTDSLPPRPFRLLPAGTTLTGWGSHPLRLCTFARRTAFCGLQPVQPGSSSGQSKSLPRTETQRLCVLDSGNGRLIDACVDSRRLGPVNLAIPRSILVKLELTSQDLIFYTGSAP